MKSKIEQLLIQHGPIAVPAKIHLERRYNVRYSMSKKGAILRMPSNISANDKIRYTEQFLGWVKKQLDNRLDLAQLYTVKSYRHGDIMQVGQRTYTLHINVGDRKTHGGRLLHRDIYLELSNAQEGMALTSSIKTLLSRLIAQDFLPAISQRVAVLNQQYFQKKIKGVRLKYNRSNWGSCSSSGNVNLSTRLLFAPDLVIDYVIIHELAHLVEMNHSPRFWAVVSNVMSDYKRQEKWLKQNGHLCDF
ncbi:MAG: M48 family metallopeptidase [Saprospiraceae bacterium]